MNGFVEILIIEDTIRYKYRQELVKILSRTTKNEYQGFIRQNIDCQPGRAASTDKQETDEQ